MTSKLCMVVETCMNTQGHRRITNACSQRARYRGEEKRANDYTFTFRPCAHCGGCARYVICAELGALRTVLINWRMPIGCKQGISVLPSM